MGEVQGVLESRLGDSFHGSAAYWGESGAVDLTPEPGQNALHVDTYFMAAVDDAPDPDVHVWFDLVVSGGCQPDGTLTLSIDPEHVARRREPRRARGDRWRLRVRRHGSRAGATCIQSGVEDTVRAAFSSLSSSGFTMHGVGACQTDPTLAWRVTNTGDIVLESVAPTAHPSARRLAPACRGEASAFWVMRVASGNRAREPPSRCYWPLAPCLVGWCGGRCLVG